MPDTTRGFVDLQVNGWRGTDFSARDLTEERFSQACRSVLDAGTAAFLPTVITASMAIYERNLPIIARVISLPEFRRRIPGIHLEGPFISVQDGARGAHPAAYVQPPDTELLERLIALSDGRLRLLTLAAELPGVEELIAWAQRSGICVSLGHQLAGDTMIATAARAGAQALTHLGNGMPSTINRHDNPLLAGLACDELAAMIITDGHHLPESLIKVILKVKGSDKTIVTSDATALSGMPPGNYEMFGSRVRRDDNGKVYNPETGYLAGSGSSIFECMNRLAALDLLDEEELNKVGFSNALRLIGHTLPAEIRPPVYDRSARRFATPDYRS